MNVPFLDLARLHRTLHHELQAAVAEAVAGSLLVGPGASRPFEQAFAAAHGRAGAVGCGSGTDALVLALRASGVGPGDEVVVPAMTFVATAEAVVRVGADPVLADVDPGTLLLTDAGLTAVRTARTKAVVPVHLYGHVVPPGVMAGWAADGLTVIEDACQAHLATWRGRRVGEAGTAACFSFYPGKNLGALGDGGMVASDDEALLARVARLRDHGSDRRYVHHEVGLCSRLDGVQAAVLAVKLPHLAGWNRRRASLADRYRRSLGGAVELVPWEPGAVHHLLVARITGGRRHEVRRLLEAAGIGTGVHYPVPLSRQPALARWRRGCPAAEQAATELLSLPMDPLMTDRDVDLVVEDLLSAIGHRPAQDRVLARR